MRDSHDVFLADDRIVTYLSAVIGKVFYKTATKRPLPVRLTQYKDKTMKKNAALPSEKKKKEPVENPSTATPQAAAAEIKRTISMTPVHLTTSITTSVRVGLSLHSPEQLSSNIEAVVADMVSKYVPRQWRGVKAIHIKGPNTMALPIWLADELWEDDNKVMEDEEAEQLRVRTPKQGDTRRALEGGVSTEDQNGVVKKRKGKTNEGADIKSKRLRLEDDGMAQEMKDRREKLRQQKKGLRAAIEI